MSLTKEGRVQRWRLAVVGVLAVAIVSDLVGLLLSRASRYGLRLEDLISCVRPHVRG